MSTTTSDAVVESLLDAHGRTFASAAGIRLGRNTPAPLFQLLCLSLLSSARISADIAMDAATALTEDGLTTPAKMLDATWEHRTKVLNEAGYARYDESTSRYLAATAELLLDDYDGDLRELREDADRDLERERELLTRFKGIGQTGAAMFLREVEVIWDEVDPFIDDSARSSAEKLGLPTEPDELRALTSDVDEFTDLVAALVRVGLAKDHDAVLAAAPGG